jgi:Flp pilus assembly protein TadD
MRSAVAAIVLTLLLPVGGATAQAVAPGDGVIPPPASQDVVTSPPVPRDVMTLPAELRDRVHREVLFGSPSEQARLERLAAFMFMPEGLGMTYSETANLTVAQAYDARTANCLTFTLLFLALAREAGLDAVPQEIEQTLGFRQADGTLYLSNHVNALVRMQGRRYVVDVAGDRIIARDRPTPIALSRLIGHYYNNLAVERLGEADYDAAKALLATALELDPRYPSYWSNVGVVQLRAGDARTAEKSYRQALALDPGNANAVFNLAGLAARTGDRAMELEYRQRLARLQRNDPFHHFMLAVNAGNAGDLTRAIRHYRRAVELQPQEHRFHSALANAYLEAGRTQEAIRSLARAQALSDGDTRAAYRDRISALRAR